MAWNVSSLEEFKTSMYLNFLGFTEVVLNTFDIFKHRWMGIKRHTNKPSDLSGTCALITGSNAGVGKATAEELVRRGSNVVLACRDLDKAVAVAKELETVQPYYDTRGSVQVVKVDLSSLDSVKDFISHLVNEKKKTVLFDYIILNAGIMAPPKRMESVDGYELQFQVNFLSHFVIAHELLRRQRQHYIDKKIRPRCVFLTSLTHHGATLKKDLSGDLQALGQYNAFKCYSNSKLAQVLAAKEFHRRMTEEGSGGGGRKKRANAFPPGSATALHPGIVQTYLAQQFFINALPSVIRPVAAPIFEKYIFPLVLREPRDAAEIVVYAATAPDSVVGGKYVQDGVVVPSSAASNDPVLAKELWIKAETLGGVDPV